MANSLYYVVALALFVICHASIPLGVNGLQGRIIGGTQAGVNSAPFIVSMQKKTPQGNVHYCGGTILNQNWVVTAAHCLSSKSLVYSSVLIAGSIPVSGVSNTAQKRNIDFFVVHDLYNGGTAPYDIGLVYTKTAFQWTSAVKAASLPKANSIPSGNAAVFGWGSTSTTSQPKYPTHLQTAAPLPIVTFSQCEKALGSPLNNNLHETNICTISPKGICTSDSGGSLMQGNTLTGIVSWGKSPCGNAKFPSVYVRVSAFIDWIAKHQKAP